MDGRREQAVCANAAWTKGTWIELGGPQGVAKGTRDGEFDGRRSTAVGGCCGYVPLFIQAKNKVVNGGGRIWGVQGLLSDGGRVRKTEGWNTSVVAPHMQVVLPSMPKVGRPLAGWFLVPTNTLDFQVPGSQFPCFPATLLSQVLVYWHLPAPFLTARVCSTHETASTLSLT